MDGKPVIRRVNSSIDTSINLNQSTNIILQKVKKETRDKADKNTTDFLH